MYPVAHHIGFKCVTAFLLYNISTTLYEMNSIKQSEADSLIQLNITLEGIRRIKDAEYNTPDSYRKSRGEGQTA